jgi:hypothetical protein
MNKGSIMPCGEMKCLSLNDPKYSRSWSFVGAPILMISLLTISLSMFSGADLQSIAVSAAVDIDTSGDGRAAAYDGEEGIATDGDSFCSITNDIAGGKFSSLFEGIVGDCDNDNNNLQSLDQLLVEYSYTKNPVKIGEKTYLTITVKDKETGNPISNAFVTLEVEPLTASSVDSSIDGTAVAAAGILSSPEAVKEKTTQTMYTDNNGHATFTLQIGPKSDVGIYDTQLEVKKNSYQSSFQQTNLRVV